LVFVEVLVFELQFAVEGRGHEGDLVVVFHVFMGAGWVG
jgi:hypothetical protein